jgi:alkylation response protein AidB-like acyl-CoA dehydrogenase
VQQLVRELLAAHNPAITEPRRFLEAQYDAGLAWVHNRVGEGGLELDASLQTVVDAELSAAGAPRPDIARNVIGFGMAAPTVATHGSREQRRRYLRPLFTGEEVWCQLFSEPGAGSDLAGLATRAQRDGDEWIINGQKVWTTLGHVARWGLLLARSDPDRPKHRGLTYFIADMHAPGVNVRPLRQLTGEGEFNEVYLTDVRLSDRLRLGEVNDGWRVAMTTLMHERVAIGDRRTERGEGSIGIAVRLFQEHGARDPVRLDQLMRLWVDAEVGRLTNQRARQLREQGHPGPEGSVGKLALAELNQRIYNFCVNLMGPHGVLYSDYTMSRPQQVSVTQGDPRRLFLRSRANPIEGGTSEVLRNVLGERVLGLPSEPRGDRDLSWRDVPRS